MTVFAHSIQTTIETVVLVQNRTSSITIGAHAGISAANISLISYTWDGGTLAQDLGSISPTLSHVGSVLSLIEKLLLKLPISIIVKSGTSTVTVGQDASLTATTGSPQIFSEASEAASATA